MFLSLEKWKHLVLLMPVIVFLLQYYTYHWSYIVYIRQLSSSFHIITHLEENFISARTWTWKVSTSVHLRSHQNVPLLSAKLLWLVCSKAQLFDLRANWPATFLPFWKLFWHFLFPLVIIILIMQQQLSSLQRKKLLEKILGSYGSYLR